MVPVTVWERWRDPEEGIPGHWAFNHYEEGHAEREEPVPFRDGQGQEYKNQRDSWSRGTWRKRFRYFDDERRIVEA